MKQASHVILSLVLLFCSTGCGEDLPSAMGFDEDVFLVTGLKGEDPVICSIREVFEVTIETPAAEPLYTLRAIEPAGMEKFLLVKNLILLGTFSENDSMKDILYEILDSGARDEVRESGAQLFVRSDWMAHGQHLVIVAAEDYTHLIDFTTTNRDILLDLMDRAIRERIAKKVFGEGVKREVKDIARLYDWTIDIPGDYRRRHYYPEEGFISYWKRVPDRMIFIYWEDGLNEIDERSFRSLRNDLTGKYYEMDSIADRGFTTKKNVFEDRTSLSVAGFWENVNYTMGGYFTSKYVAVEGQNRTYLVDGCIFAPGVEKRKYIKEIEAILATFRMQQ